MRRLGRDDTSTSSLEVFRLRLAVLRLIRVSTTNRRPLTSRNAGQGPFACAQRSSSVDAWLTIWTGGASHRSRPTSRREASSPPSIGAMRRFPTRRVSPDRAAVPNPNCHLLVQKSRPAVPTLSRTVWG